MRTYMHVGVSSLHPHTADIVCVFIVCATWATGNTSLEMKRETETETEKEREREVRGEMRLDG